MQPLFSQCMCAYVGNCTQYMPVHAQTTSRTHQELTLHFPSGREAEGWKERNFLSLYHLSVLFESFHLVYIIFTRTMKNKPHFVGG